MKHPISLRTPLGRVRGLGSAHEGTGHFLGQRITAIVLIPLTLWFIAALLHLTQNDTPEQVAQWLSCGLNTALLLVMLAALFWHAKLGMQIIVEDYFHCTLTKMTALLLNLFFMGGAFLLSALAVLRLHFHMIPLPA